MLASRPMKLQCPVRTLTGMVGSDVPAAFVDGAVVVAAEEEAVGEVGLAALGPGDEVVGVGVDGWAVAAGESASAIAGGEGAALGGGVDADFAAEVEGDPVRVDE